MRWTYIIPLRIRSLFERRAVEHDLDDEIRFHIEQHIEQLQARGMSAGAARTEAMRAMGGIERRKEECREERGVGVVENLVADIRHAFRRLARTPSFTIVALVTLALGLGANTAIFTVVNGVLLRPLEYEDPDRLVVPAGTVAPGDFLAWRESNRTLERIGAAEWWAPALLSADKPEQITALHVSSDVFPLLGVEPLLGRVPRADEETSAAGSVVVLGYGSWNRRFAGDTNAIGKTLSLNGVPHTIIGVMPPSFQFAPYWATNAEMWAPLVLDARRNDRSGSSLRVFARLKDDVSAEQARADLASIVTGVDDAHAAWAKKLAIVPLRSLVTEGVDSQLAILQGAVLLLLLIACANVAHLQLMRASAGERESAVRIALGASSHRVVQQSLVESALLCTAGSVLGLGLGFAAVRALIAFAPPGLPRVSAITFDSRVFAVLGVLSLGATLLCGLVPALRMGRVNVSDAMRAGRGSNDTRRRRRIRSALVVSEFAMTLVLLAGAGLVLRSFSAMMQVDPGFDTQRTTQMQIGLRGTMVAAPEARAPFFAALIERVRTIPGVESVAMTNHIPIAGDHWPFPFSIEGRPVAAPGSESRALFRVSTPGYFATMGIAMQQGRDFSIDDVRASARVVVINDAMARHHWPNADPLGQRISVSDPAKGDWFTVVGVVASVKQGRWTEDAGAEMYFPYLPAVGTERGLAAFLHPDQMTLVIRASGDLAQVTGAADDIVHDMNRDVVVSNASTLAAIVAGEFVQPTFYLLLLGSFAFVALALASVGIYGVISYSVAQRTRELGVRAALGAARSDALGLVLRQGLSLAAAGGAIGLVVALMSMRFAQSMLFQVKPTDPLTLGVVCALLGLVALAASYLPARRAAAVDPAIALRSE